jgi:hypothetical protein
VEDDRGPVLVEDLAHLDAVLHVGDDRDTGDEPALAGELAVDLEEGRLGVVDHDEAGRTEPGKLAAELRADRASGAGHHHDLGADVTGDSFEVDLDRLAAEDVLDLYWAELRRQIAVAADELRQPRQRLHRQAGGARRLDDPPAHLA